MLPLYPMLEQIIIIGVFLVFAWLIDLSARVYEWHKKRKAEKLSENILDQNLEL